MKKVFKLSMIMVVALFSLFALTSCGGVSQGMADKINDAAKNDENYTYTDLIDKLGKPVIDLTIEVLNSRSGLVTWAKGYDNYDDYEAALKDGKDVEILIVSILDNKARTAEFKAAEEE